MIFGHARIPIMDWMRAQANEALLHAGEAGEEVTSVSARVSLNIGQLAGTFHESVDEILQELLLHERGGIGQYQRTLTLTEAQNISLEEFCSRENSKRGAARC